MRPVSWKCRNCELGWSSARVVSGCTLVVVSVSHSFNMSHAGISGIIFIRHCYQYFVACVCLFWLCTKTVGVLSERFIMNETDKCMIQWDTVFPWVIAYRASLILTAVAFSRTSLQCKVMDHCLVQVFLWQSMDGLLLTRLELAIAK